MSDQAAVMDIATIKEAFYRTFSGSGELWFSYFYDNEADRRGCVDCEWEDFLEHVQDVKDGKPFDPPEKKHLEPACVERVFLR